MQLTVLFVLASIFAFASAGSIPDSDGSAVGMSEPKVTNRDINVESGGLQAESDEDVELDLRPRKGPRKPMTKRPKTKKTPKTNKPKNKPKKGLPVDVAVPSPSPSTSADSDDDTATSDSPATATSSAAAAEPSADAASDASADASADDAA